MRLYRRVWFPRPLFAFGGKNRDKLISGSRASAGIRLAAAPFPMKHCTNSPLPLYRRTRPGCHWFRRAGNPQTGAYDQLFNEREFMIGNSLTNRGTGVLRSRRIEEVTMRLASFGIV